MPTIRELPARRRLSPAMVRIFLLGRPRHRYVAGMPPLVFCRADLIVDNLGVHL